MRLGGFTGRAGVLGCAALLAAGCGSGGGKAATTHRAAAGPSAAHPCSKPAPPPSAHLASACWFAVTTRFVGAGQFSSSITKPTTPNEAAVVLYLVPGTTMHATAIRVAGPEFGYAGLSLAAAAQKFVAGEGGKVLAKPVSTTMGGRPALAYYGTDFRGDDYGLVITTVPGHGPGAGAYTAQLSARPSVFHHFTAGFTAVFRSFRFMH